MVCCHCRIGGMEYCLHRIESMVYCHCSVGSMVNSQCGVVVCMYIAMHLSSTLR